MKNEIQRFDNITELQDFISQPEIKVISIFTTEIRQIYIVYNEVEVREGITLSVNQMEILLNTAQDFVGDNPNALLTPRNIADYMDEGGYDAEDPLADPEVKEFYYNLRRLPS